MKRWEVDEGTMHYGYHSFFFFKSSAMEYAKRSSYPMVTIHDRWFGKAIRLKWPKKYPLEVYDESGRLLEVRGGYEY